jgi:hypothetical protein
MIDLWILFSTIALLCVYGAYQLLSFVIRPYFSSLRDIPGPPNPSFFSGNSREISDAPVCEAQERWIAEYGDTICWKADLNVGFLSAYNDSSTKQLFFILGGQTDDSRYKCKRTRSQSAGYLSKVESCPAVYFLYIRRRLESSILH